MRSILALAALAAFVPAASAPAARADEGMWTFDNLPTAKMKAAYGFAPDASWLARVQKASVRLEGGCSGSVVSKDGLVLTNHHCTTECTASLSSPGHDLVGNGFVALSRREERICPGMEASILQSVTDVTKRVKAATAGAPPSEIVRRRSAEIAAIDTEACSKDDGNKFCEVVSLFKGGQYKLYRYDRYDDVRIVFAPEMQAAAFGGDPDNFNFPRYDYDMALLRLYHDGKPVTFSDPLKVADITPKEGDLVFASGHPGSTDRLLTVSQLEFQRDFFLPWRIEYMAQLRGALIATGEIGDEESRQTIDQLQLVENSVKVFKGERGALVEPAFFATKVAEEKQLRDALAKDPALRAKYGDPFAEVEKIVAAQKGVWLPYQMLEARFGAGSSLLSDARILVRASAEKAKPEAQRLPEYSGQRLAAIERGVSAEGAVHPVLERLEIEFWLDKTRDYLGADNRAVKTMFGNQSSAEIARQIAETTQVDDPGFRKRLWEDPNLVATTKDPAIALVRRVDAAQRQARADYEQKVSGPLSAATEKIAGLRFDVLGDKVSPDATFTLRLSYGTVKGWVDPVFGEIKPFTYLGGLWDRATGAFPFKLVPRWADAKSRVDVKTVMNLTTTNDIVGGNSGSPLLDRQGRIVGLLFDGNIHSLGGDFGFDPALNRAVAVSAPMLLEGLRKVYGAGSLADEMSK